ncbi:hypothetical protein, partial [Paracoccus sp. EF6]
HRHAGKRRLNHLTQLGAGQWIMPLVLSGVFRLRRAQFCNSDHVGFRAARTGRVEELDISGDTATLVDEVSHFLIPVARLAIRAPEDLGEEVSGEARHFFVFDSLADREKMLAGLALQLHSSLRSESMRYHD